VVVIKNKAFLICAAIALGVIGITAYVKLISKLELKFTNRRAAGNVLADIINDRIKKIRSDGRAKIIVVGIPRGGVITADIIAKKISADLDIIIVMKLGAPNNKETAIGSIVEDDTTYINHRLIERSQIPADYTENEIFEVKQEIRNKHAKYGGTIMDRTNKIKDSIVVLVDDGAVSGATLIAATRSIKNYDPKSIIIAVPVAPRNTVKLLKREANFVEVISMPSSNFKTLSRFYQEFIPVTEREVTSVLQKSNPI
jgi:putative phosphoribosyl transferase